MRTHGTISCYQNAGCRCDDCRRAARLKKLRLRGPNLDDFRVSAPAKNNGRRVYFSRACVFCNDWFYNLPQHEGLCGRG